MLHRCLCCSFCWLNCRFSSRLRRACSRIIAHLPLLLLLLPLLFPTPTPTPRRIWSRLHTRIGHYLLVPCMSAAPSRQSITKIAASGYICFLVVTTTGRAFIQRLSSPLPCCACAFFPSHHTHHQTHIISLSHLHSLGNAVYGDTPSPLPHRVPYEVIAVWSTLFSPLYLLYPLRCAVLILSLDLSISAVSVSSLVSYKRRIHWCHASVWCSLSPTKRVNNAECDCCY